MVTLDQEFGDCDLCVEFCQNKNPVSCQGNLITAPAEFDVTFDFAIYLRSEKYNRKIERSIHLSKCLLLSRRKFCCWWENILFSIDRPENFLQLFLKTMYQC